MLKKLIWIGSLAVLSIAPLSSYARTAEDRLAIQSIIVSAAAEYGVDPGLGIFLAAVESDFNPRARSRVSSATGLFQFIDSSWKGLCRGDRLNPVDNTRCAMKLIAGGGISHWTADLNTKRKLLKAGFITEHGALAVNLVY